MSKIDKFVTDIIDDFKDYPEDSTEIRIKTIRHILYTLLEESSSNKEFVTEADSYWNHYNSGN